MANPIKIVKAVKKAAAKKSASNANKRGLKAANKPTNKIGSKQDRKDREFYQGKTNLIKNASPMRPNRVRGGSLRAMKEYGGRGLVDAPKKRRMSDKDLIDLNMDINKAGKKRRSK